MAHIVRLEITSSETTVLEIMLDRFRRLLGELMRGATGRNSFAPWELTLLLDLQQCHLNPRHRLETLRQYQKAVERQLASGPGPPMKLSDFLERKKQQKLPPGAPAASAGLSQ